MPCDSDHVEPTIKEREESRDWERLAARQNGDFLHLLARRLMGLRDRVAALESKPKSAKFRGFHVQRPGKSLVRRVAWAISPSMFSDPLLHRQEARDAIAEIADYLESEGFPCAASHLREKLEAEA